MKHPVVEHFIRSSRACHDESPGFTIKKVRDPPKDVFSSTVPRDELTARGQHRPRVANITGPSVFPQENPVGPRGAFG